MDDAEASELIAALIERLISSRFSWVVEEVRAAIALGRPVAKQARGPTYTDDISFGGFGGPVAAERRTERLTTEPLSVLEQLDLYLAAIEIVAPQRLAMEAALIEETGVASINFVPDELGLEGSDLVAKEFVGPSAHTVSADQITLTRFRLGQVVRTLGTLREQVRARSL